MRQRRHLGISLLAVWSVVAASPKPAEAATVTVTITGFVSGGEDQSGYFIPARTLFAGQSFTLIYTFDDQKGVPDQNGAGIGSTSSSNPGTAVLTINNGKSFAWGGMFPLSSIGSSILKFVPPPGTDGNFQVNVGEFYNVRLGNDSSAGGSSAVQMSISPATGTVLTGNANWEASFSNSNLNSEVWGYFRIGRSVFTVGVGFSDEIAVNGYLYPQSITVSGPDACSTIVPSYNQGPFFKITDPVNSVPSSMPGSAICPATEDVVKACSNFEPATSIDNDTYHLGFHVYKEKHLPAQWGAECAYYPANPMSTPANPYPIAGGLVPNYIVGHGTADFWPDWTCEHFVYDPGGPRWDPASVDVVQKACVLLGFNDYIQYWSTHPHPPGTAP